MPLRQCVLPSPTEGSGQTDVSPRKPVVPAQFGRTGTRCRAPPHSDIHSTTRPRSAGLPELRKRASRSGYADVFSLARIPFHA